ncbi:excinuclease ABC subunit UvrA [Acetobacteraceae bacterium KSS8]|uniref:UvrABC system protein A n=2 Tax=Endosaccharibacter trunci TaxID=2812733 RepID=A0ABT1W456_9PROT|nr:excinuclease ABC subunit UvrA [Acetobacteraceae bacterium KSS8]
MNDAHEADHGDHAARVGNGFVVVRGARQNNLANVDVDIPRDRFVVFTGVSGSGKSSLAFGTLFAESQRRYLESVAPYARRLIDQAGIPEVDHIGGLPPAIALQQQRGIPSARSSVGSVTTMSSLMRMLYSRAGTYPDDQPMLYAEDFSPNTVQGACPACHGLGRIYDATEDTMVPDPSRTIRDRAIASWPPAWHGQNLRDILVSLGYDVDVPWRDLPRKDRDWILFTDETPTVPVYAGLTPKQTREALRRKAEPSYQGTYTGARRYVLDTFANSGSAMMKKRVSRFIVGRDCPACGGKRLKPEALSVTFAGHDIAAIGALPFSALRDLFAPIARGEFGGDGPSGTVLNRKKRADAVSKRVAAGLSAHNAAPDIRRTPNLSDEKRLAARRLAEELLERLHPLIDLGLGYLSLDRATPSLSFGEMQRLRLAAQLSAHLFGVVYVLDEPSAGLHPADGDALLGILRRLRASGNSLFVVEHNLDLIRNADWIVDVGPAAGAGGGRILYSGPIAGLADRRDSATRRYLFDPPRPEAHAPRTPVAWLELAGVSRNTLRRLDVSFPLGCFTAVTGVSGSGKSTLVSQALPDLVGARLGQTAPASVPDDADLLLDAPDPVTQGRVVGDLGGIRRVVRVDQKPIGRTPRSNLATYTGLFDPVRRLFAATPLARKHRYGPGRFSFNIAEGRCPVCEGEGSVMVELLFLPSVYAPCAACGGTRFNPDTLAIRWNGHNIADVLHMTVDQACGAFQDEAPIARALVLLREIGLGYLRLGQPATELSGGEAQRVKLATELQRAQRGDTLYVLDEPASGLHPADADRLMRHLHGLVEAGNTVVAVEHAMRLVVQADWVIDMGPGAGKAGGHIVASGPPAAVAGRRDSRTAPYLAAALRG